jgi:hypothetical protein
VDETWDMLLVVEADPAEVQAMHDTAKRHKGDHLSVQRILQNDRLTLYAAVKYKHDVAHNLSDLITQLPPRRWEMAKCLQRLEMTSLAQYMASLPADDLTAWFNTQVQAVQGPLPCINATDRIAAAPDTNVPAAAHPEALGGNDRGQSSGPAAVHVSAMDVAEPVHESTHTPSLLDGGAVQEVGEEEGRGESVDAAAANVVEGYASMGATRYPNLHRRRGHRWELNLTVPRNPGLLRVMREFANTFNNPEERMQTDRFFAQQDLDDGLRFARSCDRLQWSLLEGMQKPDLDDMVMALQVLELRSLSEYVASHADDDLRDWYVEEAGEYVYRAVIQRELYGRPTRHCSSLSRHGQCKAPIRRGTGDREDTEEVDDGQSFEDRTQTISTEEVSRIRT